MTLQKDLKRLVRARMKKTGESYTSARAQLVKKANPSAAKAPPLPANYLELAGMSDAALSARTGRTWPEWVRVLDRVGAAGMRHADVARHLHAVEGVPSWWSQMVTVGYERIRGLRDVGQRRGGGYEVSRSRTIAAPAARIFRAFSERRARARWLPGVALEIRTATPSRSLRITWPDGTDVHVWIQEKGAAKGQVGIQHGRLASKADAEKARAYWGERLPVLAAMLART
jgi:hypothetical protein